jgi:hypothetical protein
LKTPPDSCQSSCEDACAARAEAPRGIQMAMR